MTFLILAAAGHATAADAHEPWLRSFYRTHDLRPFAGYWTEVMEQRVLEQPGQVEPTVGFVSQLLRQNPSLVRTHLVALSAYPLAQREAMARILALSDTPEGRTRLREAGRTALANRTPRPIAQHRIQEATDLDFCWGWFFATGDLSALDPIVASLDLAGFAGGRERYATSGKTANDRIAARNDSLYEAATRSLTANTRADPFIARHLESILRDPRTPPARAAELAEIVRAAKAKS